MDCHSVREADGVTLAPDTLLAGGRPFSGPWGLVYSANITEFTELGDEQLERLIRGQVNDLYPMPTQAFNQMAENDMHDLLAYLDSLEPRAVARPPNRLNPDFPIPGPNVPVPVPVRAPEGVTVERGQYLVTMAACSDCHTPKVDGQPDLSRFLGGGGLVINTPKGRYTAPNITPDRETGIGGWSDAEIRNALREGTAPGGHQLNPAMSYASAYHAYTDDDVNAVILFLRSLPPVHHPLPENPVWRAAGVPQP